MCVCVCVCVCVNVYSYVTMANLLYLVNMQYYQQTFYITHYILLVTGAYTEILDWGKWGGRLCQWGSGYTVLKNNVNSKKNYFIQILYTTELFTYSLIHSHQGPFTPAPWSHIAMALLSDMINDGIFSYQKRQCKHTRTTLHRLFGHKEVFI